MSTGQGCVDPDGAGPLELGDGQFCVNAVSTDSSNNIYVSDSCNHRIQKFDASGSFVGKWGSHCNIRTEQGCVDPDGAGPLELGDGQLRNPAGIAINSTGYVYVNDSGNQRIQIFKRS